MTMSDRAGFEKLFPVPLGVKWCERQQGYTYENYRALDSAASYSGKWQAWQAALTQSGQGKEPVSPGDPLPCPFCGSTDVGGAGGTVSCYRCPAEIAVQNANTAYAVELWNNRVSAHPQPDQQGSVPDREQIKSACTSFFHWWYNQPGSNAQKGFDEWFEAFGRYEFTATPQPEVDGWIKCSERLPTEADNDFNGCVWVLFEDGDIDLMEAEEVEDTWDIGISITHWKPTGLKRPQPPRGA